MSAMGAQTIRKTVMAVSHDPSQYSAVVADKCEAREAEPEGVTPRLEGDDKAQGNDTPEANSGRLEADATTAPSHQGDAGGNVDARKDVDADVPMTDDKRHGKADESPNAGDAEDDGEHVQEGDEDAVIY